VSRAAPMLDTVCEVLTPEGVVLRLPSAGPFPRALAWLIDACARLSVLVAAGTVLGMLGELGAGVLLVVLFALIWFYPVVFEVLWNGQTLGKRALGIRVVAVNGAPVGWMAAFVRNLLRVVDMLPALYAVGLVTGLFDPWGRRLGDLVAGTLVVHVPRAASAGAMTPVPARPPAVALALDEQRALVGFAERAHTLTPQRCQELAELARPITGEGGEAGVQALLGVSRWLVGPSAAAAGAAPRSPR